MGLLLLFTRPEVMGAWAAGVARDGAEEKFWKGIPSLSGLVIRYSPCRPQLDLDLSGKPCLTSEVQPPSQGGHRKVHPGAFRKTRWSRLWHWDERGTPGPFWADGDSHGQLACVPSSTHRIPENGPCHWLVLTLPPGGDTGAPGEGAVPSAPLVAGSSLAGWDVGYEKPV